MKTLYFSVFFCLVVLLTSVSTQNAHAQFGLFDTVWTMNGLAENYSVKLSPNDSLMKIWTWERPQNVSRYRLYNTITKVLIWDTTGLRLGNILSDNHTILSWDTNIVTIRDLFTLEPISSVNYIRPNFSGCTEPWGGISEIDTSVYSAGYCGATAIKGISYKVNYRTGQVKETSNILPYFAMTISEDGQYVAGVYYTGGTAVNDPYNEVIEVRKISDYSVVFREEKYYSDWKQNFVPYQWVTGYKFMFSKDNKFLVLDINKGNYEGTFRIYDLYTKSITYQKEAEKLKFNHVISFTKDSKSLFYKEETIGAGFNTIEVRYLQINLGTMQQSTFLFPINSKIFSGGDKLLFNDNYLLSKESSIYESDYSTWVSYNTSLSKLNFDLNSMLEPENPIQGILYPNPSNMNLKLNLELNTPITINATIHNTEGQLIKDYGLEQYKQGENVFSFDVANIPSGIYFLKLIGQRFNQTYKVIINR